MKIEEFMEVNRLLDLGISTVLVVVVLWFLSTRVWPWFTTSYWPSRQALQAETVTILSEIREGLMGLQIAQNAYTLDRHTILETLVQLNLSLTSLERNQQQFLDVTIALKERLLGLESTLQILINKDKDKSQ